MKPHWRKIHEWRESDIYFLLDQIWQFKKLLRKHPDNSIGYGFRDTIKLLKKELSLEIKEYERVYGDKPNVRKMREEVEV